METRRARLYRISGKAEARYQRRITASAGDAHYYSTLAEVWSSSLLVNEADRLVVSLTIARLSEPAEYRT
jgi:hypothetical protein